MTDTQGADAAIETTGAKEATERDFDAEAREGGWKPKDEYTGDPKKWRDAKSYVEYGELKAEVRGEFEDRFKRLERTTDRNLKVIKQGYEAQITDLKSQKTAAVKAGNVDLVERIDKAIETTKEAAKDDGESPIEENVNAAFKKRNPWYGDDDDLTAEAIVQSNAVSQAYTLKHGKPMPDNLMLEAVERKIKASADYQKKFGNKSSANGHADVDGGSDSPGAPRKTGKTASDLPPEAKKAAEKFIAQGLFKNLGEYAKDYFANE